MYSPPAMKRSYSTTLKILIANARSLRDRAIDEIRPSARAGWARL